MTINVAHDASPDVSDTAARFFDLADDFRVSSFYDGEKYALRQAASRWCADVAYSLYVQGLEHGRGLHETSREWLSYKVAYPPVLGDSVI